ncbi:hypothetical protein [Psychroflexus halocasei]|uniref:DUF4163 domain-containing protein n=1 Tax=Psychroflexus halocasei TaxID=908615 RepID=A0A1H4DF30_9FLAO|nr:hypothetical protein [Psychroflexus halocasei]SEA71029.1 hypothetical protein SAMN05421540_1113 [Psychroflexus halocasei]
MKNLISFLLLLNLSFVAQSQEKDTLVIQIKDDVIKEFLYINDIDIFGKKIDQSHSTQLKFLFTNQSLKDKLSQKRKQDSNRNSKRIKGKPFVSVVGYSSGSPQFGIELNYYQKDSVSLKSYNKSRNYYLNFAERLKQSGATKKEVSNFRRDMLNTLYPPLIQLFADESFLKNKTLFEFDGSSGNYKIFRKELNSHQVYFIQMPYYASDIYGFKYHFIQVRERYITPGL